MVFFIYPLTYQLVKSQRPQSSTLWLPRWSMLNSTPLPLPFYILLLLWIALSAVVALTAISLTLCRSSSFTSLNVLVICSTRKDLSNEIVKFCLQWFVLGWFVNYSLPPNFVISCVSISQLESSKVAPLTDCWMILVDQKLSIVGW